MLPDSELAKTEQPKDIVIRIGGVSVSLGKSVEVEWSAIKAVDSEGLCLKLLRGVNLIDKT